MIVRSQTLSFAIHYYIPFFFGPLHITASLGDDKRKPIDITPRLSSTYCYKSKDNCQARILNIETYQWKKKVILLSLDSNLGLGQTFSYRVQDIKGGDEFLNVVVEI